MNQKLNFKINVNINLKIFLISIFIIESVVFSIFCYKKDIASYPQLEENYSAIKNSVEHSFFNKDTPLKDFFNPLQNSEKNQASFFESPSPLDLLTSYDSFTSSNNLRVNRPYQYRVSNFKILTNLFYLVHSIDPKWIMFYFNLICYLLIELLIYLICFYLSKNPTSSLITMLIVGINLYTINALLNSSPTLLFSALLVLGVIFLHSLLMIKPSLTTETKTKTKNSFFILLAHFILYTCINIFSDFECILSSYFISICFIIYSLFKNKVFYLYYTLVSLIEILIATYLAADFSSGIIALIYQIPLYRTLDVIKVCTYNLLSKYHFHYFSNIFVLYFIYLLFKTICNLRKDPDPGSKDLLVNIKSPNMLLYLVFSYIPSFKKQVPLIVIGFTVGILSLGFNLNADLFQTNYILVASILFIFFSIFIKTKRTLLVYGFSFLLTFIVSLSKEDLKIKNHPDLPEGINPSTMYIYAPYYSKESFDLPLFIRHIPTNSSFHLISSLDNLSKNISKEQKSVFILFEQESKNHPTNSAKLVETLRNKDGYSYDKLYQLEQGIILYALYFQE